LSFVLARRHRKTVKLFSIHHAEGVTLELTRLRFFALSQNRFTFFFYLFSFFLVLEGRGKKLGFHFLHTPNPSRGEPHYRFTFAFLLLPFYLFFDAGD
jgi:hypothetical protein